VSVLAHTRVGVGPRALFLLHGFLGAARNLATLARGLAQRLPDRSVITLDLTGHGDSPPLPPRPDVTGIARDVLDTARALDTPAPWTLIGHSLGGRVVLHAALLLPTAFAHLTLLDVTPSPRPPGADVSAIVKALGDAPVVARDRQTFRAWFRQAGLPPAAIDWLLLNLVHEGDTYHWRIDRRSLTALYAEIGAEDLWAAIERSRRPYTVHVIRGGASDHVSDGDAERLRAARCRVDTIDDASHFVHVDRPDELLDRIVQGLP
jgi:pimeloyl-ACP methyl ester carboxylesterase